MFTVEERVRILDALNSSVEDPGLNAAHSWGDRIEDRGSQITSSGLGRQAPLDAKKAWNPDFTKRERPQAALIHLVADVAVRVGGSTSVDVTRKGVDKIAWQVVQQTLISVEPARRSTHADVRNFAR
jgi:phosphomannomutase